MSAEFKFCPKCGKAIIEGDMFCRYCGASLGQPENNKSDEVSKEELIKKDATDSFFDMVDNKDNGTKSNNCQDAFTNLAYVPGANSEWQPANQQNPENSSVPPAVASHFNWGAFLYNWIWCLRYKKYKYAILIFIGNLIPLVNLVAFGFAVYFGIKGNMWAWQARQYKSVEEFHSIQKRWVWLPLVIGLPIGIIAALSITVPTLTNSTNVQLYKTNAKKAVAILSMSSQIKQAKEEMLDDFSSEGLASYFKSEAKDGKMINAASFKDAYNIEYDFVGDGNCKNSKCYVKVDTNSSDKGPNKEWTEIAKPSDILIIPIKNENGYPVFSIPSMYTGSTDNKPIATSAVKEKQSGTLPVQKSAEKPIANFDDYMADVKSKIKQKWNPRKYESSKHAVVLFTVAKDGKLINAKIEKSSGDAEFDNLSLDTIKKVSFSPLPTSFEGDNVDIKFTFDYSVY